MSEIAVRVEGLGKQYQLGQTRERYATLRDRIHALASPRGWFRRQPQRSGSTAFWALKDISFEVKRGDVVGIIGRNGAGKSTLLKILSRITEPTEGEADLRGRVGSLLEVGTGFHPELTGRENIFLNGAILGMKRAAIVRDFADIVAFAEVEKFIDTPVKHYSSGMYMRLAFAVAAHLEPEILVVDEVLAVGDTAFQKKCLGKMGEVARGGRTVLFVSHNMGAVQALCSTVVRLTGGKVASIGTAAQEVVAYLADGAGTLEISNQPIGSDLLVAKLGFHPSAIPTGGSAEFCVSVRASADVALEHFAGLIYSSLDTRVGIIDLRSGDGVYRIAAGQKLTVRVSVSRLELVPGTYKLGLFIGSGSTLADFTDLTTFEIVPSNRLPVVAPYPESARGIVEFDTAPPAVVLESA